MKIKVMADYLSSGIWDVDTQEMLCAHSLGLSEEIQKELESFNAFYEKCDDWKPVEDRKQDFDFKLLDKMAEKIASLIKKENPAWEVYFFREELLKSDKESEEGYLSKID